jgi:hypothetical protein
MAVLVCAAGLASCRPDVQVGSSDTLKGILLQIPRGLINCDLRLLKP